MIFYNFFGRLVTMAQSPTKNGSFRPCRAIFQLRSRAMLPQKAFAQMKNVPFFPIR
jgi:hypothetical protein